MIRLTFKLARREPRGAGNKLILRYLAEPLVVLPRCNGSLRRLAYIGSAAGQLGFGSVSTDVLVGGRRKIVAIYCEQGIGDMMESPDGRRRGMKYIKARP